MRQIILSGLPRFHIQIGMFSIYCPKKELLGWIELNISPRQRWSLRKESRMVFKQSGLFLSRSHRLHALWSDSNEYLRIKSVWLSLSIITWHLVIWVRIYDDWSRAAFAQRRESVNGVGKIRAGMTVTGISWIVKCRRLDSTRHVWETDLFMISTPTLTLRHVR